MSGDASRAEQLASVTPEEVTDFVQSLTRRNERMPGPYTMIAIYPTADARKLGLARRHLETLIEWKPGTKIGERLKPMLDVIGKALKTAIVDKTDDTVAFFFVSDEIDVLREAVQPLDQYASIRAADARPSRGRRK